MFSALIAFFGGSVFRMIWGEVSSWATAKQNHDHEIERLQLQSEFEGQQHARNLESIKLQNELGVKVIQVQRDSDMDRLEGEAWTGLVDSTTKLSGTTFLDVWNGAIRPMLATLAISVVIAEIVRNGFTLSEWDRELVGAILGIYVADRSLLKRGK